MKYKFNIFLKKMVKIDKTGDFYHLGKRAVELKIGKGAIFTNFKKGGRFSSLLIKKEKISQQ